MGNSKKALCGPGNEKIPIVKLAAAFCGELWKELLGTLGNRLFSCQGDGGSCHELTGLGHACGQTQVIQPRRPFRLEFPHGRPAAPWQKCAGCQSHMPLNIARACNTLCSECSLLRMHTGQGKLVFLFNPAYAAKVGSKANTDHDYNPAPLQCPTCL